MGREGAGILLSPLPLRDCRILGAGFEIVTRRPGWITYVIRERLVKLPGGSFERTPEMDVNRDRSEGSGKVPGRWTVWHSDQPGQMLIVISGCGWAQRGVGR
jgi:hypothetical protein